MPSNLVKTPQQEVHWERAKKAVKKQYPNIPEGSERFYKLTTSIFKNMEGKPKTAEAIFAEKIAAMSPESFIRYCRKSDK